MDVRISFLCPATISMDLVHIISLSPGRSIDFNPSPVYTAPSFRNSVFPMLSFQATSSQERYHLRERPMDVQRRQRKLLDAAKVHIKNIIRGTYVT